MNSLHYPIRTIIADDHEIFRDGFELLLKNVHGIELVGAVSNGRQLIDIAEFKRPDVILTDIQMPEIDGIRATKYLKLKYPELGIIALSMYDDDCLISEMMQAGAQGYLLKNASKREIVQAIKTVKRGGKFYCSGTTRKLTKWVAFSDFNKGHFSSHPFFTEKERVIIRMICEERSSKEISIALGISKRTVDGYRKKLMAKTKSNNIAGFVIYAIRHGLYKI